MWTLVLAVLACAPLALAQVTSPAVPGGQPLLIRLEGELHASADAAREKGREVATFGFLGKQADGEHRYLAVDQARTIGADDAHLGKDVLNDLRPFDPNLMLAGPPELLDRVRKAPAGAKVVLEGLLDRGQHTYLLRDVRVG